LLFWLPFYYHEGLGYDVSVSGYMSTSFEFGGMIGTPFIGWLSDKYLYGRRDVTAAIFMAAASGMLALCNMASGSGVVINSASMFLVGILVIGPDSVLSGTIAQDIGNSSVYGSAVSF
jgi:sugar phosphate permease